MNDDQNLERALFRYGLIHPLLDDSLSPGEKSALRKQILSKTYDIPHSSRTTVSERTLRQYLQWYREGGFAALMQTQRPGKGAGHFGGSIKKGLCLKRRTAYVQYP